MVFTFSQTASNKQTKKSLGCHQVSSLDMNMLSHPQGVATAVVYSTADGAMWAKDREIGRFRRSVNLLRNMEYNHRKNWIYPGQQVSWLVMWFFFLLEDVPGNTPQASACFVGAFQVLQVPERTGKFGAAQYSSMARKLPHMTKRLCLQKTDENGKLWIIRDDPHFCKINCHFQICHSPRR